MSTDRELTRRVAIAMGWQLRSDATVDIFVRSMRREIGIECHYDEAGALIEGAVRSSVGTHTLWTQFDRSVQMLLGRDLLKVDL
jgi:hypothetical protein